MKLGELSNIKTGKLDVNAEDKNGVYPFFTCAVEPTRINTYAFDCECILVAGNGDLNVKYYNGKFNAYQRTYVIDVTKKDKLYTRFLYYLLSKQLEKLRNLSIGGVIKYIKLNNLTDIPIPNISLDTQRKIAEILDKADAARAKRQEALRLTDQFLKSTFLEMFGDPIKNPKKWEMRKLSEVGTLDRGKSENRPRNAPELLGGPYPLIQTGDIANSDTYITKYNQTYSELGLKQSKMWPAGTLCITIAANIGKTAILVFDACFPDSVVGFVANKKVKTEYVHFWFRFWQKILEDKAPESAQKNINLGILRNMNITLPPIDLQQKFTRIVEKAEGLKATQRASAQELDNLFNSLMQKAFRGGL